MTGLRDLLHDPQARIAVALLAALVGVALIGPIVVTASPTKVELADRFLPPVWSGGEWSRPLGSDALGRDVLARLLAGARVSLLVGVAVVAASALVGTSAGLVAGYRGGIVDAIVMRLADAQLAFPGLVLVLAVVGAVGASIPAIVAILVALGWMVYARLARGIAAHLRTGGHVRAAELMGCSLPRVVFRHLLPAISGPLVTQATLELGRVMLTEAALSYLGLGIQPPDASWGLMVAENQPYLATAWWTVTLPGLALAGAVLATNLLSGAVRSHLDPVQRAVLASRRSRRHAPTAPSRPLPTEPHSS